MLGGGRLKVLVERWVGMPIAQGSDIVVDEYLSGQGALVGPDRTCGRDADAPYPKFSQLRYTR